MTYILLLVYIFCSAFGMVLIKSGGQTTGLNIDKVGLGMQFSWVFILGAILYILSFLLWMVILQKFPLTYISPVSYGILFVVTAIVSYFVLKETLSLMQILGIAMIIGGVIVSTIGKK